MDIELHFFQDDDANTCKDKKFFYQAGCDLDATSGLHQCYLNA